MRTKQKLTCLAILYCFTVVGLPLPAQAFHNEIGLYSDLASDPGSATITIEPMTLFDVYVTVTNPYNYEFKPAPWDEPIERPIELIEAIYLAIHEPESGFVLGQVSPNSEAAASHIEVPDYAFSFMPSIPVPASGIVHLLTLTCMVFDTDPKEIRIGPVSENFWGGEHGTGAFLRDRESVGPWVAYSPSSGDFSLPVFGINQTVVTTDAESWDGVKALYR